MVKSGRAPGKIDEKNSPCDPPLNLDIIYNDTTKVRGQIHGCKIFVVSGQLDAGSDEKQVIIAVALMV